MDDNGPTLERLRHADGNYTDVGYRARRRLVMFDDALGRAWMRRKIADEEYSALRRYALHWLAGGLQGGLHTVDLDRVQGRQIETGAEARQDHRDAYWAAHGAIGKRPAEVADQVACYDVPLVRVGTDLLGYRSSWRGYERAAVILSDAGYRLAQFWKARD